jgi:Leu/Phe-tRNA-protein transferase
MQKSEITQACLMQVIKNCKLDAQTNTWIADQLYKMIMEARIEGAVGEVG